MNMVKDTKQTVTNVDCFIENNRIQKVGTYKTHFRNRYYFVVNGVNVKRKEIGNVIFVYCEKNDLHKKKWATMIQDYKKQIESIYCL